MTAKVDVFMPVYIGDYLADTTDLTTEEHGAYFLLMMALWKNDGRLPCDPSRLAKIAGLSRRRWDNVWVIIGRFFDLDDGHIFQKRLLEEIEKARNRKRRASDNGHLGASKRWPGYSETVASGATEVDSSSPSPSPSPSEKKQEPPKAPQGGRVRGGSWPDDFRVWYAAYPRKVAPAKAAKAWRQTAQERPDLSAMLARLDAHKREWATREWDRIPYPASYLSAHQFADEMPRAPPRGNAQPERPLYTGHDPP